MFCLSTPVTLELEHFILKRSSKVSRIPQRIKVRLARADHGLRCAFLLIISDATIVYLYALDR